MGRLELPRNQKKNPKPNRELYPPETRGTKSRTLNSEPFNTEPGPFTPLNPKPLNPKPLNPKSERRRPSPGPGPLGGSSGHLHDGPGRRLRKFRVTEDVASGLVARLVGWLGWSAFRAVDR